MPDGRRLFTSLFSRRLYPQNLYSGHQLPSDIWHILRIVKLGYADGLE